MFLEKLARFLLTRWLGAFIIIVILPPLLYFSLIGVISIRSTLDYRSLSICLLQTVVYVTAKSENSIANHVNRIKNANFIILHSQNIFV